MKSIRHGGGGGGGFLSVCFVNNNLQFIKMIKLSNSNQLLGWKLSHVVFRNVS